MFTSLRSRLWLSYAVLILVVLCVFSGTVAISLLNNPVLYRNAVVAMQTENRSLVQRLNNSASIGDILLGTKPLLESAASLSGFRYLLLSRDGQLLYDTDASGQALVRQPKLRAPAADAPFINGFVRDTKGRVWIYTAQKLTAGIWLATLTPRPRLILANLFRDEIIRPMLLAGGIALLVAVLFTFLLARSVAAPLKRLSQATSQLAAEHYPTIQPEGPAEVRQVAQSFNEMSVRVRNSQQSQHDFIANVSHELKTPLTSIQGFAQAILDGTVQKPDELNQAAGIIHQEAGRLQRLVVDLLALTRLESGTADLKSEPVNLRLLLQAVLDKFGLQARQNDIELEGNIEVLPVITGDGDRLAQVFTNLVDNALKFTPAGGKVNLSARYDSGKVMIRVTDSGVGIDPAEQQRIFERFYQVDKSRQGGTGRGIGLGLAIARQIISAHHGEISVQSEPGKGTTFQVSLPVAPDTSPVGRK